MLGKDVDRESKSAAGRLRCRVAIAAGVIAVVAGVLPFSRALIRSLLRPPYTRVVDELPISARLVRHEFIRHGVDFCDLFEFSCSDVTLRDTLVSKWRLRDLTGTRQDPVSFVENDHPVWWPSSTSVATHKFGRRDEDAESYISVWDYSETGQLFVELGVW
jgi:hypothetical protein